MIVNPTDMCLIETRVTVVDVGPLRSDTVIFNTAFEFCSDYAISKVWMGNIIVFFCVKMSVYWVETQIPWRKTRKLR